MLVEYNWYWTRLNAVQCHREEKLPYTNREFLHKKLTWQVALVTTLSSPPVNSVSLREGGGQEGW